MTPGPAKPAVLVLGPAREAISGVSTHVNALLGSALAEGFALEHFQVGSEGRNEIALARALRLLASPFLLMLSILRNNAQVVHLNTSLNAKAFWRDLAYLLVAKLCGARVLYQVHGGTLARFARPRAFLRAVMRLPDQIVVLSLAELEAFRALVPSQAVELVPNGIACASSHEKKDHGKNELELLYLGRLAPGKGLWETIEGLRHARQAGARARLVIAGSGPEEARLRQQVRAARLEEAVSFAGPAYGVGKARLYARADVLILASHSEGLPYAVLEAMAAGVVPVVTRVGALPDVVLEGEHGLFVELRDPHSVAQAICRLAAARDTLERMGGACRKRIATGYSIRRLAGDFAALYAGLCAARSPKAVL